MKDKPEKPSRVTHCDEYCWLVTDLIELGSLPMFATCNLALINQP